MKTTIETITPKKAQEYLDARDPEYQRKVQDATVRHYACIMQFGSWHLTHQGIALDAQGRLIDGQHRLLAVIASAMPQKFMVTRGCATETLGVLDHGTPRSVADYLSMRGYTNCKAVASAARHVGMLLCPGSPLPKRLDASRAENIINLYRPHINAVLNTMLRGVRIWHKAAVYAPLIVARYAAKESMDDFMTKLADGSNLQPDTPAYSLFRWRCDDGMNPDGGRKNVSMILLSNAVAMAAKKHYAGESMKVVNKLSRAGVDFWLQQQPRQVKAIRKMFGLNGING